MARRRHVEPLQRIWFVACPQLVEPVGGVRKLRLEFNRDFNADFVATTANGGTDCGDQVCGLCAELHFHFANVFGDDALQCAAPACMNRGDGSFFGVGQENRNAVGSLNGKEQAWTVGGGGIASARHRWGSVKEMNDVGMNLAKSAKHEVLCAERKLEAAAVFKDVFLAIPLRETEIQDLFAAKIANAAGPRAETVQEPWHSGQSGRLKYSQIPGLDFGPFLRGRSALRLFLAYAAVRF